MTTTVLDAKISEDENKIINTSSLVTPTALNTKISKVENKISDNSKQNTTQQSSKLMSESFAARSKQADLVNKTDKLTNFNKRITSNKTKHLAVQKKLNSLITKDYNFFLGRVYDTSNHGSQNTLVYQPTLDTLQYKNTKVLILFLVRNQREYLIQNISHYILLSYIE